MFWHWGWYPALHAVLAAVAIIAVLLRRKEPASMLAWIFAIVMLPIVGVLAYVLIGSDRIHRRASRKRHRIADLLRRFKHWAEQRTHEAGGGFAAHLPDDLGLIERLTRRLAQFPATAGNDVRVYQEANATYAALEEALRGAKHHIHLEYYIWQPDETGRAFRDLLIEKARQGVQCRLLLDAVGCLRLPRRFVQPMIDAGVRVEFFFRLFPFRKRWSLNLRNHRKIAVVDGSIAFLGSQNIGDEYRGRRKKLSPWYDSHMRIRGAAVLFVQQTFAEDWLFATYERLDEDAFFPEPPHAGESIVQVLPTGPTQDMEVLGQLVFAAVSAAKKSIRIETPYFVPGSGVRMALKHACLRGVRVQLVLPTRGDAPLVLWAGRSFYEELIDAGIEIYEFDGGVLHSKVMTIDDRWYILGSANMDVRSFRLNFELTALVYDEKLARSLAESIENRRQQSRRILQRELQRKPIRHRLIEGGSRLFSPLL